MKKKKKVLFIMSTNDFSGAENVNFDIIANLKEKYDFYWVSKKGKINKFLEERQINWIEIKKLNVSEIKRVIKLNNPDILHATDFRASFITALANKKCKTIAHLHNDWPWLRRPGIKSLAFLFTGFKVNNILTVSDSIEKEFIFSNFIKNKIMCIGNPINIKKISDKIKGLKIEKKYDICCVARITEQKNPFKFIEIIKNLTKTNENIKAVWVGDGELKDEVNRKIKEEKLEKNIQLVGFQKNPYIYMAESKVFLLTSDWEGFGLVVVEALTLGLPCVVSNVGGLKEIVNNKCGKLCKEKEEFIMEIKKLLKEEEYFKAKKNGATNRIKELDNHNDYYKNISIIYNKIMEDKNE